MSGTSQSFNCNQFTKDQAEHWTEKDRRSHLTLGCQLILAQLHLPANTGEVPHPAPVPGGGLNSILRQITRIKLTAVKSISVASSMALVSSREMDCQTPLDGPGATETCISLIDLAANYQSQKQGIYWEVWTCAICTDKILCVIVYSQQNKPGTSLWKNCTKHSWSNRIVNDIQWEIR